MKKTSFGIVSILVALALMAQGVLVWLFNVVFNIITEVLAMNLSEFEMIILLNIPVAEYQFICGPILIALAVLCIIGSFKGKKFGAANLALFIALAVKFCIDLVFRSMDFFVDLMNELSYLLYESLDTGVSLTNTVFGILDYTFDAVRICGLLLIAALNILLFAAILSKKEKFISVAKRLSLLNILLVIVSAASQLLGALSYVVYGFVFSPYPVSALSAVPLFVDAVSAAVVGIGLCAPMLLARLKEREAPEVEPAPKEFEENYPEASVVAEEQTEEPEQTEGAELPERSSSREVTPNDAEGSTEENPLEITPAAVVEQGKEQEESESI